GGRCPPAAKQRCGRDRTTHGLCHAARRCRRRRLAGDVRVTNPELREGVQAWEKHRPAPPVTPPEPPKPAAVPPPAPPTVSLDPPAPPRTPGPVRSVLSFAVGWTWRVIVGAKLCFNAYFLSYLTSIIVVGWSYRWMQAVVLRGWWKQSRLSKVESFADFCASLGPNAPAPRPRWFLQERIGTALRRPAPGGADPGPLRLFVRLLKVPLHSLWLNVRLGVQGLLCTYLMTGWGCLLIWISWRYGWLNSFHKGYEEAWFGPTLGIIGSLLLIAALFYVPMAQVHQAATGQARAFFDFRFVW